MIVKPDVLKHIWHVLMRISKNTLLPYRGLFFKIQNESLRPRQLAEKQSFFRLFVFFTFYSDIFWQDLFLRRHWEELFHLSYGHLSVVHLAVSLNPSSVQITSCSDKTASYCHIWPQVTLLICHPSETAVVLILAAKCCLGDKYDVWQVTAGTLLMQQQVQWQ